MAAVLSAENFHQLYIPPGFAHGFCVQSAQAQVVYKVSGSWDPADEITIAWDDPQLAIDWPVEKPVISEKDRRGVSLVEASARLSPSDGEAES